ncbi:MAG: SagB/ThcOx family dehydrogenase [Endomicrobia bacterium]|nr:SagB/ThcOx family dehydrogenase [Endomicrobiia bacterium]
MMKYKLPPPKYKGEYSVEETIYKRRSVRKFEEVCLSLEIISQLLWASYGITEKTNSLKTVPSAGATYPLEIYYLDNGGIYHYLPEEHSVELVKEGNFKKKLAEVCLGQSFVSEASISLVICVVYERTVLYYGERGYRYVYIEAGHSAQNVCLQAVALGLASVCIGAFYDNEVKKMLSLCSGVEPIYIISIGKEKK